MKEVKKHAQARRRNRGGESNFKGTQAGSPSLQSLDKFREKTTQGPKRVEPPSGNACRMPRSVATKGGKKKMAKTLSNSECPRKTTTREEGKADEEAGLTHSFSGLPPWESPLRTGTRGGLGLCGQGLREKTKPYVSQSKSRKKDPPICLEKMDLGEKRKTKHFWGDGFKRQVDKGAKRV